jgi:hypothetical protein
MGSQVIARARTRQITRVPRSEGLDPIEESPMRDVDAALSKQLKHLPAGRRVGQVPAHSGQDHIGWPAVAAED